MFRELSVAEQRYQAVSAVTEDGLQVSEAAVKTGVTLKALHSWLNRYAEGGLEALADRSHRPRSCPHQMDAAVEVRLVELRGVHPAGCRPAAGGNSVSAQAAGPATGGPE